MMPSLAKLPAAIRRFRVPGGLALMRRDSEGRDEYGEDAQIAEYQVTLDPVVVLPIDGETRRQLPEGERDRERIRVWACIPLRGVVGGSASAADVVMYDPTAGMLGPSEPRRYIVEEVSAWHHIAGLWRARAVREEVT